MARVRTVGPRVGKAPSRTLGTTNTDARRIAGRALQKIRLRLWSANPYCAECGRITAWPYGFEVDHIVPLENGGPDTDDNRQILCVENDIVDGRLVKTGCHIDKTAADRRR